ncbi:hypothetical protein [Paracoccus sp. M683]|uniref:hypothetical protein n=1 Tax=Paracoccus sp. M683 TaxID=2594268 RepID=UPI00210333A7|nr:hypothetical protein [Paracoccus sp. M683]
MWVFTGSDLTQIDGMLTRALRLVSLVLALSLPMAALPPTPAAAQGVIDIINDSGGNVMDAVSRRQRLQASGKLVRIRGYCRSACTIYLSLPNACLAPRATVGFHAPRLPGTSIIPPLVADIMAQFYRGDVRRHWLAKWQYSLDMHKMSAAQYLQLDPQMRYCPRS